MPEGPEIRHERDVLRREILGMSIVEIIYSDSFKRNSGKIDTELVDSELPLLISQIISRAKRLIFVTLNNKNQDSAFVWFYAMTGSLCFQESKHTQMTMYLKNFKTKEEKVLHYEDKLNWGFVKFCTRPDQVYDIFKSIGPDFMNGEVTLEYFTSVIRNKRIKNKMIATLLLEQDRISSIGNYVRCDSLFEAGISPYRKLLDISDKEIPILYKSIEKILTEAYNSHGLTIGDYYDPYGNQGKYVARVYGLDFDRDGNKVVAEKFGPKPKGKDNRRTIHWCPAVQK